MRAALLVMFVASSCVCDSGTPDSDGGLPEDAGVLFELPAVDAGASCDGLSIDAGLACVPASWFYLPRWSTALANENGVGVVHAKQSAVYLDRFFVMRHEVTNGEWRDYALDAGAAFPPEQCGCTDVFISYDEVTTRVSEYSGWQPDGGLWGANVNRPVACITREEARAFCIAQGGRLPSVVEYLRLTRGEAPSQRPYPWGETPPVFNDGTNFKQSMQGYIEPGPTAPEIGTRQNGGNEYGVYELVDGVSEYAWECLDALEPSGWTDAGIVIRPERSIDVARCSGAPVVVGENFLMNPWPQHCCSMSAYSMPPASHLLFESANGKRPVAVPQFGNPECTESHPDVRLRTVGFRCAFDAPP